MKTRLHVLPLDPRAERGVALVTTMLVMMLMSALLIGFTAAVTSDQRYRLIDRDRVNAFYAAQSGLEKLNAELSLLFFENVSPTADQIAALADDPPDITDVTFTTEGNGAYGIAQTGSETATITSGPYAGLIALKTVYDLEATARTAGGGEVHLRRSVETVAIPVFQFGMFSDVDLSFHAGPAFNFGGRIHTNGNLFLTHGDGNTLTLPEKVTAVGEIIRKRLANGNTIANADQEGTIRMARAPGSYRNLLATEGSVQDGPDSDVNTSWPTISLSTYNSYIRDGTTGAEELRLPLTLDEIGGTNADLVLRPPPGEDGTNPTLLAERLFTQASLRILLSDTAADITSLPNVSAGDPIELAGNWATTPPAGYGPVSATNPPIALSPAPVTWGTVSGAVAAGNNRTITLSTAMPAAWSPPAIEIDLNGIGWDTINCSGRSTTGTQFTGCRTTGNFTRVARNNDDVRATVDGVVVTTEVNTGANINIPNSSSAGITVTVDSTAGFFPAPVSFWANNELVTCNAQNATQLLDCDNAPTLATGNTLTNGFVSNGDVAVIGGFIKIEKQDADDGWEDVTLEILNYGIAGNNLLENGIGVACGEPNPNAIIKLQRLRDNTYTSGTCGYAASQAATDYWPNVLFDPREGLQRDTSPGTTTLPLGGVMHYIALDVGNLRLWFDGADPYAAGNGDNALTDNGGFSVYFSDRRANRNADDDETGEYGFEDVINPDTTGVPDAGLDEGEDVNENETLDVYGGVTSFGGVSGEAAPGAVAPFNDTATPATLVSRNAAQTSRAILFRRALKLVNGGLGNVPLPGFTVVSENPVYVQGDFNANQSGFGETNAASAIIADAVTILSSNWNDNNSFNSPYATAGRARSTQSYYRFAVIAGKNQAFTRPTTGNPSQDFGTDGGAHNFLRMLESGGTVNYRGSIATFYYSRQATGVYKCCTTVYGAPTRVFNFDSDFLSPSNLPPLTPMFRDINALGFTQETRPGR